MNTLDVTIMTIIHQSGHISRIVCCREATESSLDRDCDVIY